MLAGGSWKAALSLTETAPAQARAPRRQVGTQGIAPRKRRVSAARDAGRRVTARDSVF